MHLISPGSWVPAATLEAPSASSLSGSGIPLKQQRSLGPSLNYQSQACWIPPKSAPRTHPKHFFICMRVFFFFSVLGTKHVIQGKWPTAGLHAQPCSKVFWTHCVPLSFAWICCAFFSCDTTFLFVFESYWVMLRGAWSYSWLDTQESLAILRGSYGIPEMNRVGWVQASTLPAVLWI